MKTGGVATSTGCPVPRRPAVTVQEHTIAVPTNWVVREDRPSAQRTDHRRAFDVFDAAVRTKDNGLALLNCDATDHAARELDPSRARLAIDQQVADRAAADADTAPDREELVVAKDEHLRGISHGRLGHTHSRRETAETVGVRVFGLEQEREPIDLDLHDLTLFRSIRRPLLAH